MPAPPASSLCLGATPAGNPPRQGNGDRASAAGGGRRLEAGGGGRGRRGGASDQGWVEGAPRRRTYGPQPPRAQLSPGAPTPFPPSLRAAGGQRDLASGVFGILGTWLAEVEGSVRQGAGMRRGRVVGPEGGTSRADCWSGSQHPAVGWWERADLPLTEPQGQGEWVCWGAGA